MLTDKTIRFHGFLPINPSSKNATAVAPLFHLLPPSHCIPKPSVAFMSRLNFRSAALLATALLLLLAIISAPIKWFLQVESSCNASPIIPDPLLQLPIHLQGIKSPD
jgi:hypothetical protein